MTFHAALHCTLVSWTLDWGTWSFRGDLLLLVYLCRMNGTTGRQTECRALSESRNGLDNEGEDVCVGIVDEMSVM
jgi:hypothetical protein